MVVKSNFGTTPPPPAKGIPTLDLQCFDRGVQSTPVDPEISTIFDQHFFSSKASLRLDVMPRHATTIVNLTNQLREQNEKNDRQLNDKINVKMTT